MLPVLLPLGFGVALTGARARWRWLRAGGCPVMISGPAVLGAADAEDSENPGCETTGVTTGTTEATIAGNCHCTRSALAFAGWEA